MTQLFKLAAGFMLVLFAACGGGANKGYTLPANNPMKEFSPPDADELVEDEGMDDFDEEDEEESTESDAPSGDSPAEGSVAPAVAPSV